MPEISAGAKAAAEWVRANPGAMQWRVIQAIQGTGSYDTARKKIKEAIAAGLIEGRQVGRNLFLYPSANGTERPS